MPMVGQTAGGIYAGSEDWYSWDVTAAPKNAPRDTFAEVALTRVNDVSPGDGVWAQIGIKQVVSTSNGVENWPDGTGFRRAVFRKGMTSVTFTMVVGNSFGHGRWFLNYWS